MTYQLMRFGAALSLGGALTVVACGGTDSAGGGTTPDASSSGTGGGSTGNGGNATGNGGNATGNGGNATGNGGAVTGNGGNATGNGGAGNGGAGNAGAGNGGVGGAGALTCPAQQPNNGDPCNATGTCPYGGETCACVRGGGGAQRTFRCFAAPDGGFNPGGDAGGPAACAHTTECTTGVCCGFNQGATARCISAANCTRFGGTEIP